MNEKTIQPDPRSCPAPDRVVRYKERDTDLLYDCQVFDDAALVRPAGTFSNVIDMLRIEDFNERFEEFYGRIT